MTQKVNLDNDWKLKDALREAVDKNCKEIPWEGTEVDKEGIVEDILNYLATNHYSLLRHTKNPYR